MSSHIKKMTLRSAADPFSDSFRCDACGQIWMTPKAHRDGASLKHGDHACRIYSTDEELVEAVADFVAEGRQRGERCWYVAAGREDAVIAAALRQRGIDAAADMRSGAFRVIPSSDAYPVQNTFVPERSMHVFSDAIEQALRDGFSGFRAAAEMSWALGPDGPTEQLIVYESLLRSLFSSARVTGLCLYPRRSTPLAVMNAVLETHPLAASRGPLKANRFYDAAVNTLTPVKDAVVLSRLKQLDDRPPKSVRPRR